METTQVSMQHSLCLGKESSAAGRAMTVLSNSALPTRRVRFQDITTDESVNHVEKSQLPTSCDHPPIKKMDFGVSFARNFYTHRDIDPLEESVSSIETLRTSNHFQDEGLLDLCDLAALMMPPSIARPLAPLVRNSETNMAA
eukprot:CAMPEP_0119025760 /NCGR_PEP_ID=MMETSP1176-20130426/34269_1 /TAXON_ID=265551 /ORGANISM="Synedropsis recta cf, Strain CCMP1620" /LENGTH=141 /DNA_ID=CAMNT_0006981351 /DNA_START=60 /DNA_END=485 /DNA_ORIENTATION=-